MKNRNRIDKCNKKVLLRLPKNDHLAITFAFTPLAERWGKLLFNKNKNKNKIGLLKK